MRIHRKLFGTIWTRERDAVTMLDAATTTVFAIIANIIVVLAAASADTAIALNIEAIMTYTVNLMVG
ncbi:unnamed protein product [Dovyalis caffra]|uniref:Uncharacterized protein n=1 Tax=Dovyalis caffra TaxID=77055 RepID=A0AAV1RMR4_9ROSI|nr:unnamed protein product [Dovyalis caffra]